MSLPLISAICTTLLFGFLAIYFSSREEKLKKELQRRDTIAKRRLYEISTLRAIQDRIGYSLDIERIIDTLVGSLKNLFPYSTASSLLIETNKLIFKTMIDEAVNMNFINDVKKSMTASLSTLLDRQLPSFVEEIRTGMLPDNENTKILASFFHIPLTVNGQIVGLINVSSTKPGLYKDADMTILYQMASIASSALSRLRQVIEAEEAKLLAMIGSLSDGLIFLNEKFEITIINKIARKLLDIENKENVTFADILPILKTDLTLLIKQATLEKKVKETKLNLDRKTIQIFISPVIQNVENAQNVIGTNVILHDITLEESLNTLKEDFTNAIVHELRSPLTAIKYGAELLLSDKSLNSSQKNLMDIIDEQSKRMISDINSLLDAAKMESGKFTIYKKAEDISSIITETIQLFKAEAEQKNILLNTTISYDLPKADIDRDRVSEVLRNLISNSLKYTPSGGTININSELLDHQHLPQSAINPGILVSVSDTGIGIPIEKQQFIFNKFAQIGKGPMPKAQQGTGLGLYISKGIIEAHGGQIYLSSSEGKGTKVSFTLPIIEEKKEMINRSFLNLPSSNPT